MRPRGNKWLYGRGCMHTNAPIQRSCASWASHMISGGCSPISCKLRALHVGMSQRHSMGFKHQWNEVQRARQFSPEPPSPVFLLSRHHPVGVHGLQGCRGYGLSQGRPCGILKLGQLVVLVLLSAVYVCCREPGTGACSSAGGTHRQSFCCLTKSLCPRHCVDPYK